MGGGVDYWMGLPLSELFQWLNELVKQLQDEQEQMDAAGR
jgi:hypothetical protein